MSLPPDIQHQEIPFDDSHIGEAEAIWRREAELAIEALPAEIRRSVVDACSAVGLSPDWTFDVLTTTCALIDFERSERQLVMSPSQHYEAIRGVRDAAIKLREALGVLSVNDVLDLGGAAYECEVDTGASALNRAQLISVATADAPLAMLVKASEKLLCDRSQDQGKGGRRPLLTNYGFYVQCLAEAFIQEGLQVGRGGAFERLCTVVFEAAGVRASPEGAIRYYLAERKKRAPNGPENSSEEAAE